MNPPALCLAACLALRAAPPAAGPIYHPDPALWRLEVTPELGGWITTTSIQLTFKLVDPQDPDPPRNDRGIYAWWEDDNEWSGRPARKLTPADWKARMRAQRLAQEEYERRNGWRQRALRIWLNGEARSAQVRVGYAADETLECQPGENRLELFEPASGLRLVRTWWASAERTRLQIAQVRAGDAPEDGGLEVVEPGGDLAGNWRKTPSGGVAGWNRYVHANPPPGTYTLRWTGLPRQGSPCTVRVEAILDGGTEQERRWRFSHLMIPGAGPAILGTVDVEN